MRVYVSTRVVRLKQNIWFHFAPVEVCATGGRVFPACSVGILPMTSLQQPLCAHAQYHRLLYMLVPHMHRLVVLYGAAGKAIYYLYAATSACAF